MSVSEEQVRQHDEHVDHLWSGIWRTYLSIKQWEMEDRDTEKEDAVPRFGVFQALTEELLQVENELGEITPSLKSTSKLQELRKLITGHVSFVLEHYTHPYPRYAHILSLLNGEVR